MIPLLRFHWKKDEENGVASNKIGFNEIKRDRRHYYHYHYHHHRCRRPLLHHHYQHHHHDI